jgi:hypothetical protein
MSYKPTDDNEIWRFETARYVISCHALEEDMDPADSFQFDEDIAFARQADGYGPEWFCACVRVVDMEAGIELGRDTLGGCSYRSFKEFVTVERSAYFPDMVRQAIAEARTTLAKLCRCEKRA